MLPRFVRYNEFAMVSIWYLGPQPGDAKHIHSACIVLSLLLVVLPAYFRVHSFICYLILVSSAGFCMVLVGNLPYCMPLSPTLHFSPPSTYATS